ncbi:MAG: YopX protein, partial [Cyanobacteriota bacterium]
MREITFKTWDTKNKKWLDFIPPREYMLDSDEWNHVDDEDTLVYPASPLATYNNRLVHCQFTGATDKDGNKIYDEDVISVHYFKNQTAPMILRV